MSLIHESRMFLGWHAVMLRSLLGRAPGPTSMSIIFLACAQFAQVFALFLPLKILILIGSDGVPKYFRFFMTPESRDVWIVVFSVATVVLYVASIGLNTAANRVIGVGTGAIIGSKRDVSVDRRRVRSQLDRICSAYADGAVVALGFAAILLLNPAIALGLFIVVGVQLGFTHWVLGSGVPGRIPSIAKRIRRNSKAYIRYLSAFGFLALFFLLLGDYVLSGEIELIGAVLTLLLGRRIFPALGRYAQKAIAMGPKRQEIGEILS